MQRFYPQTRQGADILAEALNTTVYMPDFFEPNDPYPTEKFPPKDERDGAELQNFFGTTAEPEANTAKLVEFGNFLRSSTGVRKLGVYGFCWGGKVTIKASSSEGQDTPFNAAAIVHPAMLSVDDASKLEVPLGIYISKDEPVEEVRPSVHMVFVRFKRLTMVGILHKIVRKNCRYDQQEIIRIEER
jgi:dienelactone hydrolase